MKWDSLTIGGTMFVAGFLLTTYHAAQMLAPKRTNVVSHLAWALIGVGLFQIGSNLTASGLHDRIGS